MRFIICKEKQIFICKKQITMGNKQAKPLNIQILRAQNWIQAGQDQQKALFSSVNPYRKRLLANIVTHELIQQYELNFIAQQDYSNYVTQLSFRQCSALNKKYFHPQLNPNSIPKPITSSQSYIYPVRYFQNKSKVQMCTTIYTGYLYVDKVDLRLKEINDIPFPDLLYMFKATLNGFKFLYEKVGYFDIQEEMVFISRKGQVKVWMNSNLAKNYPNFEKNQNTSRQDNTSRQENTPREQSLENAYGSQADMIKDLIFLIQKNSDEYNSNSSIPLFSQFLTQKNIIDKLSFQHCLELFQLYLHQNNLHCSDHMKSIPELFSPEYHHTTNQTLYDQSHVNQITSHRLDQIKKKFQPMETIQEDQMHRPTVSNGRIQHKVYDQANFQQSLVSKFTPHKFSRVNQRQNTPNLPLQSDKKTVSPLYNDLNKSRYSNQSNTYNGTYYQHLQRSSNSNNNHYQQMPKKPSPIVSANNYRTFQALAFSNGSKNYQASNQASNQGNFITSSLGVPNTVNSGGSFVRPQFYANQGNQKVYICSPPPSFRVMGGVDGNNVHNNGVYVQQNQMSFGRNHHNPQQINISHQHIQAGYSVNNIHGQKQMKVSPSGMFDGNFHPGSSQRNQPSSPVKLANQGSTPVNNQIIRPKYPPNIPKSSPVKNQKQLQPHISLIQEQQEQKSTKSNIKYFTTKNSYQLDEQIANDLEKFLGLKVN